MTQEVIAADREARTIETALRQIAAKFGPCLESAVIVQAADYLAHLPNTDLSEERAATVLAEHIGCPVSALAMIPDSAAILRAMQQYAAGLQGALKQIANGDVPRPVGKGWRADGQPSKHDKCSHDVWMYEDCGECIADFARTAIGDTQ